MSRVLTFDLSLTASGWAFAVDGKLDSSGLLPSRETGVPRLIYVRNRACDKVDSLKPDLVVMEDLSYGSNDPSAQERSGLAFMIRAELLAECKAYVLCSPSSLKKFCCGSGGSPKNPVKKERILKDLALKFGHDINDNNVADAIVLSYIGMALLGDWECRIDAQREVIKKIQESNPALRHLELTAPAGELWE